MKMLGLAALACYGIHASYHLVHGSPENLLWACHLGAALAGIGFLATSALVSGIGTFLLCMGTPLWLMELAAGGEFIVTSCFTHIVALAIGMFGIARVGIPAGTWWRSLLVLVALIALCRLVTPASANVNVAFSTPPGWQGLFPSHLVYLASMIVLAGVYFAFVEVVLKRWLAPSQAGGEQP